MKLLLLSDGEKGKIPTNKNATITPSQGKWKIEIDEFCSSPPAPTPVAYQDI